jgi:dTDP-4-amino-4,6-dideoxygalactose transaminase
MIPYSRQEITDADILEVEKVLRSDFLTEGPIVPKFEKSLANYCNSSHAVAVNSATSTLHIA